VESLKLVLIFMEELLKIMEEHTVKHCTFRMTLVINLPMAGIVIQETRQEGGLSIFPC